jgi:hypothetical protein
MQKPMALSLSASTPGCSPRTDRQSPLEIPDAEGPGLAAQHAAHKAGHAHCAVAACEQVHGERGVAVGGEAARHVPDVLVQPEGLVDPHQAGRRAPAFRQGQKAGQPVLLTLERDRSRSAGRHVFSLTVDNKLA